MKRWLVFLPLVILMAFTLGCQDQQAIAELEEMRAQAELEEQSKAIVSGVLVAKTTSPRIAAALRAASRENFTNAPIRRR